MSLQKQLSTDKSVMTIKVSGVFDLSIQSEFRDAYECDGQTIKRYVLDLRDTEYMDSAAFGMLLVLRDYAGGDAADILIDNANEDIKKTFLMLQFGRMFNIS